MLADFQQAMADLVASPPLCNAVRADAGLLARRYHLTEREVQRLLGIVRHRGMQAACSVYRMNRITPLMLNLRATLRALSDRLPDVVSRYWAEHPSGHTHFYLESDRFCKWLAPLLGAGDPAIADLQREWMIVRDALAVSLTEAEVPR